MQTLDKDPLNDHGFAMIGAIIFAVAVISLGLLGAHKSGIGLNIAANDLAASQALSLAEAGLEHAYSLIKADADGFDDELSGNGTGGSLAALGTIASMDGEDQRFHQTGSSGDGYYVRIVDNYDEQNGLDDPTDDVDSKVRIVAIGRVKSASRTIELAVRSKPLFPYTAWAKDFITISGGGITDSFNSNAGPYNPGTAGSEGHIYTDGDVTLSSTSTVNGDATAVGTISTSGGATVTGAATEFADPLNLPSTPPCGPPYQASAAGITGVGAWSYDPATGLLDASGGATIWLADGSYCFAEIKLSGGSTLTVDGPVTVSVTGKFDASGGTITNTTNVASNFLIFSSGPGEVKVTGGGSAAFAIYARDSKITFSGGSDLYGAFVAKSITNSGGSNFHYDLALASVSSPNDLERLLWREVRNF